MSRSGSRIRIRDLLAEAVSALLARPARTALTTVGIVLGVGAFVAVLGLTATTSGQISQRFDELTATEITVEENAGGETATAFPADAENLVARIDGVRASGVFWSVSASAHGPVTGVPVPGARPLADPDVVAAGAGIFAAVHAVVGSGRFFDEGHVRRSDRVAVVGRGVAERLGATIIEAAPAVFIGGTAYSVVGVLDEVERHGELLNAVIVPRTTAAAAWTFPFTVSEPPRMIVDTEVGAAAVVAVQLPAALRPDLTDAFTVIPPPDPRALRDGVSSDLTGLFFALAGLCLVVGTVGIANTTLVAVLERTGEIGLRRSLGAHRWHIAGQFLAESAGLGLLGGLLGAAAGAGTVVGSAYVNDQTALIATWTLVAAPGIGLAAGLAAGLYPSLRAARTEPAAALRSGV